MFKTLETYHFVPLPAGLMEKAEAMLADITPLGLLNLGTINEVEVWGKEDILLLMKAMYNEAKHE